MNNILILNFGSTKDLLESSHLVASIKSDFPKARIELVTYKAYQGIAEIIAHVNKIHFIDDNLIQNFFQNPLYSDAFAINEFTKSIEEITAAEWEKVVNYSNDNVSAYLIGALNAIQTIGSKINEQGSVSCSDKWNIYQNFVISEGHKKTIDQIVARNHMVNVPITRDNNKFIHHPDYQVAATQNFARIRQMKGSPGTFVVGINLAAGYDGYAPDFNTLAELIEAMEDSGDYKPVLLLNGHNYQRQMANDLNNEFKNNLISINVDYVALPSVIANLDAVISPANDQLIVADAMDTKVIELREGKDGSREPASIAPDNYIIYASNESNIASDCLLALNEEFGTQLPITVMSSDNPVYRVAEDDYGHLYTQIRGKLDIQAELRYHIERSLFYQFLGYAENNALFTHIKENTNRDDLHSFVTELKAELTATVKLLLATLRSLKGLKNSENNLNTFINYLDNLILNGKQDNTIGAVVRNFEGRIENINDTDIDANIKSIEDNLFRLKSELQVITTVMTDLTSTPTEIRERSARTESAEN